MPPREKHTLYHELLDALRAGKGCALCHLAERSVRRHVESVLYESVNDTAVQSTLVKAGGYCGKHGEEVRRSGDALGVSILYANVLNALENLVSSLESKGKGARSEVYSWITHERCPACAVELEAIHRYVKILEDYLTDPEMLTAMEQSSGLCAAHGLLTLQQMVGQEARSNLVRIQTTILRRTMAEMREFCRKEDYRFRGESKGNEGSAWLRALDLVGGASRDLETR